MWRALDEAHGLFRSGEARASVLLGAFHEALSAHPRLVPQYVEIVHPDTLAPLQTAASGAIMAAAVFCGSTRIIDNVILGAAAVDPRIAGGSRA
jgi:pantoate ligase/cytidylate kinase